MVCRSSFRLILPAVLTLCLGSAGCSQPAEGPTDFGPDSAKARAAAELPLPPPWHELKGRTLTVNLPYRASSWYLWGGDTDAMGPFTFISLDNVIGGGPQGTDLAVFVYEARGPGVATLRYGLTKASETGPTAPEQRRNGTAKAYYEPTIEVK